MCDIFGKAMRDLLYRQWLKMLLSTCAIDVVLLPEVIRIEFQYPYIVDMIF